MKLLEWIKSFFECPVQWSDEKWEEVRIKMIKNPRSAIAIPDNFDVHHLLHYHKMMNDFMLAKKDKLKSTIIRQAYTDRGWK